MGRFLFGMVMTAHECACVARSVGSKKAALGQRAHHPLSLEEVNVTYRRRAFGLRDFRGSKISTP